MNPPQPLSKRALPMFPLSSERGYALAAVHVDTCSKCVLFQLVCADPNADFPHEGDLHFYLSPDNVQDLVTELQNAARALNQDQHPRGMTSKSSD